MKDLLPRILSGIVYIILIFFGTTGHPWLFTALMGVLLFVCLVEFIQITELGDQLYMAITLIGSAAVFYFFSTYLFRQESPFVMNTLAFTGPVMFLLACFTILFSSNELYIEFGKLTIGVIYIAVPFSLALTIPHIQLEFGKETVTPDILLIFILIWVSDIMAYVAGSLFGKHKMVPKISENKSWEGAVGGFIFTLLAGFVIEKYVLTESDLNWMIIGLIVAVFAPIGDVVESKLKRSFNAKDSGKLIPGHGGFLDRLDSFIFVVPMVYLYLLISAVL